jgi:3-oxoacyl-[acyl-carrier protein] reductase
LRYRTCASRPSWKTYGSAPDRALYERQRAKSADEVVASIVKDGGRATALEADLARPEAAQEIFRWAAAEFGPVNILINNAAHHEHVADDIFSITAQGIDQTFDINVKAMILLIQEFVARHRQQAATRGRVINLSTDAAQSFAGQISYGASKAAVEALTRSIAREVGPLGITVNTVAPGPVQTGYIPTPAEAKLSSSIPMRRIGNPSDIANMILFLASDAADWITGEVIHASGGHQL